MGRCLLMLSVDVDVNFTNGKQDTTVSARKNSLCLFSQALSFVLRKNSSGKKDFFKTSHCESLHNK